MGRDVDRRTFLRRLLGGILGIGVGAMATRVHIGRLDDITGGVDQFGLYVAGPDGTVIIDGTSNVLKVVSTGSLTMSGPTAGNLVSTAVDLSTGFTYNPAFLYFMDDGAGSEAGHIPNLGYTPGAGTIFTLKRASCGVVNTNQTRVQFTWAATNDETGQSRTFRYYVFQEVAF
jgi:hypothetical protein